MALFGRSNPDQPDEASPEVASSDDARRAADQLLADAQAQMKNGNWEQAWRLSLEGTENPLAAPMSMVHLAIMSADAGNFDQAREWATRAAATHTDPNAAAYAQQILPQIEQDAQRKAAAAQSQPTADAGAHAGSDDPAMLEMADVSASMGDLDQARSIYRGVASNPNPEYAAIALFNWGNLEYEQGNLAEALALYERAAQCNQPSTHLFALFNAGNTARDLQRWDAARNHYGAVAESGDPDLAPRAMLCLAGVANATGDRDAEHDWLSRAAASGHPDISPRASELLAR